MKRILLVLPLLLLGGCSQIQIAQKDTALKLYVQGLLYESQSQVELATSAFQKAITRGADAGYIYLKLGQISLKTRDLKTAEAYFKKALTIDEKNEDAWFGLGIVYFHQQKNQQAISCLEKGLQLSPSATALRMVLCDLLVGSGRYQEAVKHYQFLIEENKRNPLFHFNYATILEKVGKDEEAEQEFKQALALSPSFYKAAMALGLLYERTNRVAEAEALYRRLIQADPKNHLPYLLLQGIYARRNDLEGVRRILEEGLKNGVQQVEFYHALGSLALEENQYEKAEEYLKKALEIEETSQIYFSLGIVYDRMKDPDRMEKSMKRAIELKPDNAMALNYLGYSYLLKKDLSPERLKEAFSLIKKACQLEPENGAFLDSLGWAYYLMGQYRKAEKMLLKASLLEEDPEIFEHLGHLYLKKNDYEKAILWWSKSLELKYNGEVARNLQEVMQKLRKKKY